MMNARVDNFIEQCIYEKNISNIPYLKYLSKTSLFYSALEMRATKVYTL